MFELRYNCGEHYFKSEHEHLDDAITKWLANKGLHSAGCKRKALGFILDRSINQIVYPVNFANEPEE